MLRDNHPDSFLLHEDAPELSDDEEKATLPEQHRSIVAKVAAIREGKQEESPWSISSDSLNGTELSTRPPGVFD